MSGVKSVKLRLVAMSFLQFGVWGSYLTSMGSFLSSVGLASYIGLFYAMQGIVSIFMPTLMGIVADRWVPSQRLYGILHLMAALFMGCLAYVALQGGDNLLWPMLTLYTLSVMFFMPTVALSYSVAYSILEGEGEDPVKAFPPIRVWGTMGFVCSMLFCDLAGFQYDGRQFVQCAVLGVVLGVYALTLIPKCAVKGGRKSFMEGVGVRAFSLFKERRMALFFIFSMLLGVALQITNGYANPFITSFRNIPEYASTFGANHANALISLSQLSEMLCILLIPFCLRRFGIRRVLLISMLAWALRFGLFAVGDPGRGVWMFMLSMVIYGIAFDFFNISGSLYVNEQTDESIRSSAQGLFMLMNNGIGTTLGTLIAQVVFNHFVYSQTDVMAQVEGWRQAWAIFALYALVIAIAFALLFKQRYVERSPR